MTEQLIDSGITLQGEKMKAVMNDPENAELLGYGVMYTAGSDWKVLVPRDWLLKRVEELGLPEFIAPNEPRPSGAYRRAIKRLREDELGSEYITAPRMDNGVEEPHEVQLRIRDGDGKYIKHLLAEVFFDEEECKVDGGKWVQHHLGYFTYDVDGQKVIARKDDDLQESDLLYPVWEEHRSLMYRLNDEMKTTHIGHDIRQMMYYTTRDYTKSVVPLRDGGAVYFFPAQLGEFVDKMATLYDEIDTKFKSGGATMAVRKFPIFESDADWIRERVEKALSESIDDALDEAFEKFDEGEAASKVVQLLGDMLGEDGNMASQYNALLESEIAIEELLQQAKEGLQDGDKEDIIEKVLSQTDFDQF